MGESSGQPQNPTMRKLAFAVPRFSRSLSSRRVSSSSFISIRHMSYDPFPPSIIGEVSPYSVEEEGERGTLDWRMYILENGKRISPWHDIPFRPRRGSRLDNDHFLVNYVNEIPKGTNAKLELSLSEPHHPLIHDRKASKLRYINHGLLPW